MLRAMLSWVSRSPITQPPPWKSTTVGSAPSVLGPVHPRGQVAGRAGDGEVLDAAHGYDGLGGPAADGERAERLARLLGRALVHRRGAGGGEELEQAGDLRVDGHGHSFGGATDRDSGLSGS